MKATEEDKEILADMIDEHGFAEISEVLATLAHELADDATEDEADDEADQYLEIHDAFREIERKARKDNL